jgi:hypothetical protein
MAETSTRQTRIPDDIWDPLVTSAKALGTSASGLLRMIITSYNTGDPLPHNPLLPQKPTTSTR